MRESSPAQETSQTAALLISPCRPQLLLPLLSLPRPALLPQLLLLPAPLDWLTSGTSG
jgi:hypothetical protein